MGDTTSIIVAFGLTILLFGAIVTGGLLAYHFLVFENIGGFFNDLDFYNYDTESEHYLYWFFFWNIILFSGILARTSVKT